jgi:hypothetical protein
MEVEYIPLETNDEYITRGFVQDIDKDLIVVRNSYGDGDIFFFDRNGKGLKKINRRGQGPEEYTNISRITFDKDKGEMFVIDYTNRVLVYDLDGKFKRSLKSEDFRFNYFYNFDEDNLICNDSRSMNTIDNKGNIIISKQDGSITKEIHIPSEKKTLISITIRDEASNMVYRSYPPNFFAIIPYFDNWLLVDPSSDTIYRYSPDYNLTPHIVRIPSIHSMNPEVFLSLNTITDRYCFMQTIEKTYDFTKNDGYPTIDLIYDRQEKAIFEYIVFNDDFTTKQEVNIKQSVANNEIASWQILEAYQLVEDYKKGILKGKLKEIASTLKEDDNPVIMLVKHKK